MSRGPLDARRKRNEAARMSEPWTPDEWDEEAKKVKQLDDILFQMKSLVLEGGLGAAGRGAREEYLTWKQKLRERLGMPGKAGE